jgi:hypothetical protein
MNKLKNAMKGIVKYLRELSVVVGGIVITFGISHLIEVNNNKKDLNEYLLAVKLELQSNLEPLNRAHDNYKLFAGFEHYLQNNDWSNLHADSVSYYSQSFFYHPTFVPQTSAFEMFKSSGLMRLLKDKKKLQGLWHCYANLEATKEINNSYNQLKDRELDKHSALSLISTQKFDPQKLYGFLSSGVAENYANIFESCIKEVETMISQLP